MGSRVIFRQTNKRMRLLIFIEVIKLYKVCIVHFKVYSVHTYTNCTEWELSHVVFPRMTNAYKKEYFF